ncbi:hypothetical protein TOK_6187 [Pseudonocardia sp. N23]|nr:hypothetical protein TOK_6187 [Pseudonocardia sp. N23]
MWDLLDSMPRTPGPDQDDGDPMTTPNCANVQWRRVGRVVRRSRRHVDLHRVDSALCRLPQQSR